MDKTFYILGAVFGFFTRTLIYIFIFIIVGGLTGLATFEFVDNFTDKSQGVNNIVILASAFTFFPILNSLFIIFLMQENRKKNKKKKFKNTSHLEVSE